MASSHNCWRRPRSSWISLASSCSRVCTTSTSVATSFFTEPSSPPARSPAAGSAPAMRLATSDQKPDDESDCCRGADRLPRIFTHEIVCRARGLPTAHHDDVFGLGEFDFGGVQTVLNALAGDRDFFAGLVRSRFKQFFSVRDNRAEILHELVGGNVCFGAHCYLCQQLKGYARETLA